MKRIAYFVLLISILVGVLQVISQYAALPERVATHFGPGGEPDAFSTKESFTLMMLLLVLGMPGFLVLMAKLMRYLPVSMINIPNREYFLHPDRASQTLSEMETSMVWLAVITEFFMIGLVQLTIAANLKGEGLSMTAFAVLMALFLVAMIAFCVILVRRYSRSPAEQNS